MMSLLILFCESSRITLATQDSEPMEKTMNNLIFVFLFSLTLQSTAIGVRSKTKSMTTWMTLSVLATTSVDQHLAGCASLPEYILSHMAGAGEHWKQDQNSASRVYVTSRKRKMSLAIFGYFVVASEIRRRKRQMEILMMPTVVKKMILQTIASCGTSNQRCVVFQCRQLRTLLKI